MRLFQAINKIPHAFERSVRVRPFAYAESFFPLPQRPFIVAALLPVFLFGRY